MNYTLRYTIHYVIVMYQYVGSILLLSQVKLEDSFNYFS